MNIILLGAPGSGKGTQAEKLVSRQNFKQFSTGDLFRKHITEKTSLGKIAQKYIDKGELVPDEITDQMVINEISQENRNLIFDGYPRNIKQAQSLEKILTKLGQKIDRVIYLEVPEKLLIERLSGRLICPACKRSYHLENRPPKTKGLCDFDQSSLIRRPDDDPQKIQKRLQIYNQETAPLIDYYRDKGIVLHIPAQEVDSEEIYQTIIKKLKLSKDGHN